MRMPSHEVAALAATGRLTVRATVERIGALHIVPDGRSVAICGQLPRTAWGEPEPAPGDKHPGIFRCNHCTTLLRASGFDLSWAYRIVANV